MTTTRTHCICSLMLCVAFWQTPTLGADLQAPDDIHFRTATIMSEGTRMVAEVFSLRSLDGRKLPTIIMCHGWGGVAENLRSDAIVFARAGYLVITFDYRGWGASDARVILAQPAPPDKTDNRFTAEVIAVREVVDPLDQTTDLLNAIHWVQGEPQCDTSRIGLWGSSYSGGHVVYAAARDHRVKATVSQVPAFDSRWVVQIPAVRQQTYEQATRRARGEIGYPKPGARIIGDLRGAPILDRLKNYAPVEDADKAPDCAMLFVLAENEELFDNQDHGIKAYERANGPKKLEIIPGIKHYGVYGEARPQAQKLALAWYDEHLRPRRARKGEWAAYGADKANTKYSPLDQINADNVKTLKVAWRWRAADRDILEKHPKIRTWRYESTPLMVDDVLYASTSLSQVAAINPTTGETLWVYEPDSYKQGSPANHGFVHRGVAYWSDGDDRRILLATGDAYLIALDAETGKPIPTFGVNGRIDLTKGLRRPVNRMYYSVSSPPVICRDVVIVGSSILDYPRVEAMPPGDVRGFDVRTGKRRWTFHSIPLPDEFGNATWKDGSWKNGGGANVWTLMSADEQLGYVYLPFGTPANDYYGGHRPGDNLFGESLVCLNAETGERVWHYQLVHHGLWDFDLPAAPNLVDIRVDGKRVKAVAQVTKQGFCFVFNRVTGKPIWPIEEKAVPPSDVPGERASPTQPFPTRPAPFERQGLGEDDLIDFTPQLRAEAKAVIARYRTGPLFTPPTEKGTISLPSVTGGANWAGAAYDSESGYLYVPSATLPFSITLTKPPSEASPARYVGAFDLVWLRARGLLLTKPPYGRVTAIDLNTGEHAWMKPLGEGPRRHPDLSHLNLPRLGSPFRGHILVTKSLLLVAQEGGSANSRPSDRRNSVIADFYTFNPKLAAFDKTTGELIAEVDLPTNAAGAPMTYMMGGKQYIAIPVGGGNLPAELIALALPVEHED